MLFFSKIYTLVFLVNLLTVVNSENKSEKVVDQKETAVSDKEIVVDQPATAGSSIHEIRVLPPNTQDETLSHGDQMILRNGRQLFERYQVELINFMRNMSTKTFGYLKENLLKYEILSFLV